MPQDMHSTLRGCNVFSVLDINQAYHQVPAAKESQPYLTINAHIGLLVFKRTVFFKKSWTAYYLTFQRLLVAGTDGEDHPSHTLPSFGATSWCRFQAQQEPIMSGLYWSQDRWRGVIPHRG